MTDASLDLTLQRFIERLSAHDAQSISRLMAPKRAAVAALLRFDTGVAEVLLMKRVERSSDRWSGHISFPGGREDPVDRDLLQTAIRETREEVGVDLNSSAELIGCLGDVRTLPTKVSRPIAISPFVFKQSSQVTVELGDEADDYFWLPLDKVAKGELDGEHTYRLGPVPMKFPCWNYGGQVVWGLTFRILNDLLDVVR